MKPQVSNLYLEWYLVSVLVLALSPVVIEIRLNHSLWGLKHISVNSTHCSFYFRIDSVLSVFTNNLHIRILLLTNHLFETRWRHCVSGCLVTGTPPWSTWTHWGPDSTSVTSPSWPVTTRLSGDTRWYWPPARLIWGTSSYSIRLPNSR